MKGILRSLILVGIVVGTMLPSREAAAQILSNAVAVSASEVQVNQPITYTIRITNFFGGTPVRVLVTNSFSRPVELVSFSTNIFATFANTTTSGVFDIASLQPGFPAQLTLTVRAATAGLLTNLVTIFNVTFPQDTEEFVGITLVTNAVTPTNDIAVSLSGPPFGALVEDLIPYSILVANLSSTTATNVVLTNDIPSSVQIVSGNSSRVLTFARLPGGGSTNLQFTLRPTTNGVLTLSASVATPGSVDSNPTNNVASTNLVVQALVTGELIATNVGTMTFNPQHSLMEQRVRLVNVSTSVVESARLIVRGLTTNWLYNAVGTNISAGNQRDPFVVHAAPLSSGQSVDLLLEFVVTNRLPVVVPNSNYMAIAMPALSLVTSTNDGFQVTLKMLPGGARLIEFGQTVPGAVYTVLYNDAADAEWLAAQPPIVARADRVQWIDDGPPKTISHPTNVNMRLYRAVRIPGQP